MRPSENPDVHVRINHGVLGEAFCPRLQMHAKFFACAPPKGLHFYSGQTDGPAQATQKNEKLYRGSVSPLRRDRGAHEH